MVLVTSSAIQAVRSAENMTASSNARTVAMEAC